MSLEKRKSKWRHELEATRVLLRHRSCARVLGQVHQVRFFFPELEGTTIRVGLTRAAQGYACLEEPTIWLNPYHLSHYAIAHELVHLLQSRGLLPRGEKTTDLHALARHVTLADAPPGYLTVPADLFDSWIPGHIPLMRLIHDTAREALDTRERGPRQSTKWFEEALQSKWQRMRTELLPRVTRLPQLPLFG